ncbi:MAG: S26 family signal peptidase [Bacteroidales bacterium]|nr:S26 family signal peptidase [Bacteroidales bacterium]
MYVCRGELFKGDTIDRALITAFYDCKFMTDNSMYPSLNSGDIIYINTIAYRIKPIELNSVVAFKLDGFLYYISLRR